MGYVDLRTREELINDLIGLYRFELTDEEVFECENEEYVNEIKNIIEVIKQLRDEDDNSEDSFRMKKMLCKTDFIDNDYEMNVIIPYSSCLPYVGTIYLELTVYSQGLFEEYCNVLELKRNGDFVMNIRDTDDLDNLSEFIGLLNELDEALEVKTHKCKQ